MSALWIMIPATLVLGAVLLGLVVRAALRGDLDDLEAPARRLHYDDDRFPEAPRDSHLE